MHDDGVRLVALNHADVEEAGILAVHGGVHQGSFAVTVILRRLDHADLFVGERRHEVLEPVGAHDIVGVDDADDLGVGRGVSEREPQRTGLVPLDVLLVDELEPLTERAAMVLDRPPVGRIGRVVDDHHALEVRIIELRHRVERSPEHLRRLAMGRNMDRHLGRVAFRRRQRGCDEPPRTTAERNRRDLLDAGERDQEQRDEQRDAKAKRESRAEYKVMRLPEREDERTPGAHRIGRDCERNRFADCSAAACQDRQREQQAEPEREAGELPVVRVMDRSGPGELGVARGVEHTPVHADAALVGLPRLVERFDDVVVDAVGFGARDEFAKDRRLLDPPRIGVAHVVARARPAEFGDHDALAGMRLAQLVVDVDGQPDDLAGGEAVPIMQDVGGDEIDRGGQLRMVDPHRPDFTRRHRHRAQALNPLDDLAEFVDGLFRAQRGLVADHDRVDVAVATGERDRRLDLELVARLVLVDPDAERDLQPELGGDWRHEFEAAGRRVGADGVRIGTDELEIGADLLRRRPVATVGMLGARERRVGQAGQRSCNAGRCLLPLEQSP